MVSNYSVFSATGFDVPPVVAAHYRPYPRNVSQKERRRKERRRRSNGIRVRKGAR